MTSASRRLALGLWLATLALAGCASPPAAAPRTAPSALDRLVADVCGRQVVLLGEPDHHGSGSGSKILVWCATIHAARDLREIADAGSLVPLGSYLHRDLGERAAAIGFSALAGSWARIRPPPKPLAPAPPDSLEARALASDGAGVRYLDRGELARLGAIAGRAIGETFSRAAWAEVVDGMVVFRDERPPTFVRGTQPQRGQ